MARDQFKILLSLPKSLKEGIDQAAAELGQSRSAFIRDRIARGLDHYNRHECDLIRSLRGGTSRPCDEPAKVG